MNNDTAETTSEHPKSWIAWKRKAEDLEAQLAAVTAEREAALRQERDCRQIIATYARQEDDLCAATSRAEKAEKERDEAVMARRACRIQADKDAEDYLKEREELRTAAREGFEAILNVAVSPRALVSPTACLVEIEDTAGEYLAKLNT